MKVFIYLFIILLSGFMQDCFSKDKYEVPSKEIFHQYWYQQGAEITSYELSQHRYKEIRKGYVVNVFVTEPFDQVKQVKADNAKENKDAVLSLKLNHIKKFNTGIYQYSIMNSIFTPIKDDQLLPLKVSSSVQEWCGHVYLQVNHKDGEYQVAGYSYFETEGDIKKKMPAVVSEDGLWNMIRLNPNKLPVGEHVVLPSTNYLRLMHKELKGYQALFSLKKEVDKSIYSVEYKELGRKVEITFENKFPFQVLEWKETYPGLKFMNDGKKVTTTAKLHKTIHSFYWSKNKNKDGVLRKKLGLDKLLKN